MAEDLMHQSGLEHCLVVAAEEADWLLCDAFRRWRLLRKEPPLRVFRRPPGGTILSEGAGAILLARDGDVVIERIAAGGNFAKRSEAPRLLKQIVTELAPACGDVIVGSANGTFVDDAERGALETINFDCVYAPKAALGDSVGASTLWQVIIARAALLTGRLPGTSGIEEEEGSPARRTAAKLQAGARALVLACGMSQQAAGVVLSLPA
jgi:3-oxoacyl-(acyl-carrier-protein) synthase